MRAAPRILGDGHMHTIHKHERTHIRRQTDTRVRTYARMHGCAHARMPLHPPNTHAHTHTHTHTHTHAHTHSGATYRGNAVTLQKTGSMASVLASQLSDCKARDLACSARFDEPRVYVCLRVFECVCVCLQMFA